MKGILYSYKFINSYIIKYTPYLFLHAFFEILFSTLDIFFEFENFVLPFFCLFLYEF